MAVYNVFMIYMMAIGGTVVTYMNDKLETLHELLLSERLNYPIEVCFFFRFVHPKT